MRHLNLQPDLTIVNHTKQQVRALFQQHNARGLMAAQNNPLSFTEQRRYLFKKLGSTLSNITQELGKNQIIEDMNISPNLQSNTPKNLVGTQPILYRFILSTLSMRSPLIPFPVQN